jgi:hypothetical protein
MVPGIGRSTFSTWRVALRAGEPIEMEEKTRASAIRFLERSPTSPAPSYWDGVRFSIEKLEQAIDDLRELLPKATPEEHDEAASAAAQKAREPEASPAPRPRRRTSNGRGGRNE